MNERKKKRKNIDAKERKKERRKVYEKLVEKGKIAKRKIKIKSD